MKISVVPALDLSDAQRHTWHSIQLAHPALRSPFYHPRFTQLVAESGCDTRVAVLEEGCGRIVGFFPHHLHGHTLLPVGVRLNDYHGMILRDGTEVDVAQVLHACGAVHWPFDHWPLSQQFLSPYVAIRHVSLVSDVTGGWDAYLARLAQADGHKTPEVIRKTQQKERQLARELGPVRFALHSDSDEAFDTLLRWKSAQRERTGTTQDDPFELPWVAPFMQRLRSQPVPGFAGRLCTLHAGDRLVSCHFGLQTHDTLHLWFPAYDPELAYFQPSMVMWLNLFRHIAEDGVTLVDFGRGIQRFKTQFCTGGNPMGEGLAASPAALSRAYWLRQKVRLRLKNAIKASHWYAPLRASLPTKRPPRANEAKVQHKLEILRDQSL